MELERSLAEFPGKTALEQMAAAVLFMQGHGGTVLRISPGDYVLGTPFSRKLREDVLAGRMGADPEQVIFTPYYRYDTALKLEGLENCTILAEGVKFWLDGFLQAVEIKNCKNLTLRGLTVDCLHRPFAVGKTVAVGSDFIDVLFPENCPVTAAAPSPRIVWVDPVRRRFSKTMMECVRREKLAPHCIRYYGTPPLAESMGQETVVIHTYHYRPAIFLCDSVQTRLEGVTIHAQAGMGILAHHCEEMTLDGVRVVPASGMPISTNTDATHFASCKGNIRLIDCRFAGSEDDAVNVHNYDYTPVSLGENTYALRVCAPTFTHAQVIDAPDVGDTLQLIDRRTLGERGCRRVKRRDICRTELAAVAELDAPLTAEELGECFLVNASRVAQLEMRRCRVSYVLTRCLLLRAKTADIEDCVFENSTGTAVHIAPESLWHEGGATGRVTIRTCRFIGTGFGSYAIHGNAAAICAEADCPSPTEKIHGEIRMVNNRIELEPSEKCAVSIANTKHFVAEDNFILGAKEAVIER